MNRKNEFNSNAICRLQATMNECLSDKEMQQELEARKSYNMRIRKFVVEKKRNDLNGVFCDSKNNNVAVIDEEKKYVDVIVENRGNVSIDTLCCRFDITPTLKRKRVKKMETSTPISGRREINLIEIEDDSPIGNDARSSPCASDVSSDVIPTSKTKAGISDNVDGLEVTPPKEDSPDTRDRKLALHCMDIVRAAVNKDGLAELQEHETHAIPLPENPFAKRVGPPITFSDRAVGMDSMNKPLSGGVNGNRPVGMDSMNKTPKRGGNTGDITNGAVAMDEMNKNPIGGGDGVVSSTSNKIEMPPKGSELMGRKHRKGGRKLTGTSAEVTSQVNKFGLKLGERASSSLLGDRACPQGISPKRPIPMELDQATPPPVGKRKKMLGQKRLTISTPTQKRLTDMWKVVTEIRAPENELEEKEHSDKS